MGKTDQNKKLLIGAAAVCFAVAALTFATGHIIVALVFFTLAAVIPFIAIDLGGGYEERAKIDEEMIQALQNKLDSSEEDLKVQNQTIENRDNEIRAKEMTISSRDEEIASLKKQLEEAQANANNLAEVAEKAESEKEAAREDAKKSSEENRLSAILPVSNGADGRAQTLNIGAEIKSAVYEFAAVASGQGIEIRVQEPEEPMFVKASPIMIRTLFRDIIDNAVKYMKRRGSLQITIASLDEDIFIAVKDDGEGLPESETGHIFELNYQGSNRVSGNGLGLAQVKAIVDYYGGMVYAKSAPDRGMCIYLHLPAERA